jgi:hypothetical protein
MHRDTGIARVKHLTTGLAGLSLCAVVGVATLAHGATVAQRHANPAPPTTATTQSPPAPTAPSTTKRPAAVTPKKATPTPTPTKSHKKPQATSGGS